MKDYSHIKNYEDTLDLHEQKIEELNRILDVLAEVNSTAIRMMELGIKYLKGF